MLRGDIQLLMVEAFCLFVCFGDTMFVGSAGICKAGWRGSKMRERRENKNVSQRKCAGMPDGDTRKMNRCCSETLIRKKKITVVVLKGSDYH